METCRVTDCVRPVKQSAMCGMHALRMWRTGKTDDPRPSNETLFWRKVNKQEGADSCWLWTGSRNEAGYGRHKVRGRKVYAHRYSYELAYGPIPQDRPQIDHLCDTPSCVNPQHLRPSTPRTNTLRSTGVTAHNARKSHCVQGHPFAGANLYVRPNGDRCCRACRRADDLRRRGARAGALPRL